MAYHRQILTRHLRWFEYSLLTNLGRKCMHAKSSLQSRHFFQLPLDQKLRSPHPPTANPHRGFSAVGLENVSAISNYGSSTPMPLLKDMKVCLHTLLPPPTQSLSRYSYSPFYAILRSRTISDPKAIHFTAISGPQPAYTMSLSPHSPPSSQYATAPNSQSSKPFP